MTGTRVGNCLVVTISQDLSGGMLDEIRRVALTGIQKDGATSAIFELSAVPFMDTQEFKSLRDIARMSAMLGSKVIFVGLNPGIIIHLMASDADVSGMHACLGLDEALQKVQAHDEQLKTRLWTWMQSKTPSTLWVNSCTRPLNKQMKQLIRSMTAPMNF